ncbi:MBL fold metallo-hydrolase [Burkholderia ubonensis]|uniref:MBL fold metallo-hydrolase n=1 Tax=Burkholderia TaxID=32008 RepID=UPI0005ABCE94|nr:MULTISPECIES: MBL fold metallo-hydrolase [Burkholderia]KIP13676.1 metallo-beta-lactamase superfamily protein [Burkholderia sp. MSHR3999]KVD45223.1 MBL fold metallo-hydrolase [Burkholderia ubonensis]KVD60045.1 MBL fold metallo-hydrolase [Burkholderia ubonensis]
MATITAFEAGYCTHPGCVALRGAGFSACAFPSRCYLLQANGRRWLWDTGYASHFLDHTRRGVFALYRKVTPVYFDAADAIAAQLAREGLRPADLAGVVVSHFHGDHIAGLRDFPGVPMICSGDGWRATRPLRGIAALRRGFVPGLMPDDFDARACFVESFERVALPAELAPFEHAYAMPNAGGDILLVELPGHAAGHLGAFVATDSGWVLLASDSAWSPQGYREPRGPSRIAHLIMDDPRAYYATLDRLHQLDAGGRATILLTHEGAL